MNGVGILMVCTAIGATIALTADKAAGLIVIVVGAIIGLIFTWIELS